MESSWTFKCFLKHFFYVNVYLVTKKKTKYKLYWVSVKSYSAYYINWQKCTLWLGLFDMMKVGNWKHVAWVNMLYKGKIIVNTRLLSHCPVKEHTSVKSSCLYLWMRSFLCMSESAYFFSFIWSIQAYLWAFGSLLTFAIVVVLEMTMKRQIKSQQAFKLTLV